MHRPRVYVTREIFPDALDLIEKEAELEVWPEDVPPTPEQLREALSGVDGALINVMDRVDAVLLDAAPNLRVISQVAVGLDNVDVALATQRGIPVGYTPGVLAKATADLAFALLLATARRVVESDKWVREGNWEIAHHPMFWLGSEVNGSTLGILGLGGIGLEVAKRALGFDMKVIYHSRTRKPEVEAELGLKYTTTNKVLAQADFLSIHVPLTPETHHLIGEKELKKMKPTSILVNLSRGPVVDTDALCKALTKGWIAGAGLDVFDPEPVPKDHPVLGLDNVVVLPHIGSASNRSRREMCLLAARNLLAGLRGERLEECANPEVYQALGI
ncbi:MAG TPA: D-glycerate dehydrogenase [Dehalococcoidia bacterium]|nr:D-glycerate dehydrogenase [Chloroflexota bacterium]MQF94525.1 D-glycerate dehydrogenase [SAR202 cluster bacterium]HAA95439.1 D-glycerate dehydrogenase [Dehalococcoidia bacterium]HCL25417.1 D-glycerate dehydrogenase [Dehalococcoidia bacterium]|tara:strand:+ start:82 stop:1074 length:993 start_codon:yes stop_codon:yes gene_type:complete